jgi:hypothetical protein
MMTITLGRSGADAIAQFARQPRHPAIHKMMLKLRGIRFLKGINVPRRKAATQPLMMISVDRVWD